MKRIALISTLVVVFALIGAMWIYALFFASKEVVNEIADRAWTERAEIICKGAATERIALADFRPITDAGEGALLERARIVDLATDTLDRMLLKLETTKPQDAKGQAIVPMWISDYRKYITDRRTYAGQLRLGSNVAFGESMLMGIPLSEKLATFAADNFMKSCKPPMDLSI
ncbi:MAG: hypothetical protein WCI32_06085 [Actinomycetota bacterium]|jgi:hypothetical protein